MSRIQIYDRMSYILNKEEIKRLEVNELPDNKPQIMLNAHGWSVKKTQVVIDKLVKLMLGSFNLGIIHGYCNGTHIKEMLASYENDRFVATQPKYCPANNAGVTYMNFL